MYIRNVFSFYSVAWNFELLGGWTSTTCLPSLVTTKSSLSHSDCSSGGRWWSIKSFLRALATSLFLNGFLRPHEDLFRGLGPLFYAWILCTPFNILKLYGSQLFVSLMLKTKQWLCVLEVLLFDFLITLIWFLDDFSKINFRSPFNEVKVHFWSPFCSKLDPLWVLFL